VFDNVRAGSLTPEERVKGLEPDRNLLVSAANECVSGADTAKASVALSPPVAADKDLDTVIAAWATLPKAIRAAIIALSNIEPEQ
jgi:hypothetical protein